MPEFELKEDNAAEIEAGRKEPKIIAKRRSLDRKEVFSSDLGKAYGETNKEAVRDKGLIGSAAAELDAAAAKLTVAPASLAPKAEGSGRRWLLGRDGSKRRKLLENSNLQKWLLKKGVWVSDENDWGRASHACSMAIETREQQENEISGRGLIAKREIEQYEDLIRVPFSILMTKNTSQRFFGKDLLPDDTSPYGAIALQLIYEKFVMGPDSDWEPYIAVLPTTADVGASFSWPEEELAQFLMGSPTYNNSVFVWEKVRWEFAAFQEGVFKAAPEKFPPDAFTLENYIWAYACLFSRAVRLGYYDQKEQFVALVPYIDLVNHNPMSQTYIQGDKSGLELPLNIREADREVVVVAEKYYQKYEQIYLSYGPKSNGQLLMLYGFSLERNTQDFVDVILGQFLDESPLSGAKRRLLNTQGVEKSIFPLYRDRFTEEMMSYLRTVVLTEKDLELDRIPIRNTSLAAMTPEERVIWALDKCDVRLPGAGRGELVEKRALLLLKGVILEMIDTYPTSLEEDEKILQDKPMFEMLPKNARMAIRVRHGEKLILEATLTTLERMIMNLKRISEMEDEVARKNEINSKTFWGRLGITMEDPKFKPNADINDLMREMGMS